jgi:hypothetical protein
VDQNQFHNTTESRAPVTAASPPVTQPRPRVPLLDGLRGCALLLMLVSHSLQLLPLRELPAFEWQVINTLLLFTKAATPLFVWVFGMTMTYVYYDHLNDRSSFRRLTRRVWKRALLVLVSFEFLVVVVETSRGSSADSIIRRMLFLQYGHWVEVLTFYIVVLMVTPWVLKWWKKSSTLVRVISLPLLYSVGWWLSGITVADSLFVVKNIFAGYPSSIAEDIPPDTFPVLQLSAFYLIGLTVGEALFTTPAKPRVLWNRLSFGGVLCLAVSFMTSGDSLREYVRHLAKDAYRFPPQIPYILFGLFAVFSATVVFVWLYQGQRVNRKILAPVELLGRHSLLVFNTQYMLLFTIFGMLFRIHLTLGLTVTLSLALFVAFVSLAVAKGAEIMKPPRRRVATSP